MPNIHIIYTHTRNDGVRGTLGIDENGSLYWNNEKVTTENKIKLDWWVNFSAVIASLATVVMAVYTALEYYKP